MIRSEIFDDIYFSADGGLAETRHVFLASNNLPAAWAGRGHFTIAETGFGTGLNFLAAWALFDETAAPGAVLDYVSFERYPLRAAEIRTALSQWTVDLGGRLERMLEAYPLRIPGWHRLDLGRVRLTLVFDDVNNSIPRLHAPNGVDAWFLDGFAPARNPEMWTQTLFQNMARLSHEKTTLASFTAAALVKNGLREAGFFIGKRKGFGRKRDMIAGHFMADRKPQHPARPRHVAILGAGLAGSACAFVLRQRGITHTVFDPCPGPAAGASGNEGGIYNPRFRAQRDAESDFYASAYALAARTLAPLGDIVNYRQCGSLHLLTDAQKQKRLASCRDSWGWPADHMAILSAQEASAVAGVALGHDALYLPDSGCLSPRLLCGYWLHGSETRFGKTLTMQALEKYDSVILACAGATKNYLPCLPLGTVRGQVASVHANSTSSALRANICYGGYIAPAQEGLHMVGATFQKWLTGTAPREEDNAAILAALAQHIPEFSFGPGAVAGARAGLRCAAQDRLPVLGGVDAALAGRDGVYANTAHGSHGIISALAGANLIADAMEGGVCSLPQDSVAILSARRFPDRAARKGRAMV